MVIDTSALLCILLGEPEAPRFAHALAGADRRLVSAFSLLEAAAGITARKGDGGGRELDLLLHRGGIEVVAFTPEHAELAREAWLKYGKGRHCAGLNIGDCCAYALALYAGEPLLFKGEDFPKTDVTPVPLG